MKRREFTRYFYVESLSGGQQANHKLTPLTGEVCRGFFNADASRPPRVTGVITRWQPSHPKCLTGGDVAIALASPELRGECLRQVSAGNAALYQRVGAPLQVQQDKPEFLERKKSGK